MPCSMGTRLKRSGVKSDKSGLRKSAALKALAKTQTVLSKTGALKVPASQYRFADLKVVIANSTTPTQLLPSSRAIPPAGCRWGLGSVSVTVGFTFPQCIEPWHPSARRALSSSSRIARICSPVTLFGPVCRRSYLVVVWVCKKATHILGVENIESVRAARCAATVVGSG